MLTLNGFCSGILSSNSLTTGRTEDGDVVESFHLFPARVETLNNLGNN